MKKHSLFLVLAAGLVVCSTNLQPAHADDEMQAKYEEKIAKPFVSHGSWIVDYDEALARAEKEKRFIFAYFTRSYAR